MSAYQYPASAPAAPYAMDAATDPTAVMGRRIGAWIVDLLLFLLLSSFFGPTPLSPLAQYVEVPSGVHNACGTLQDNGDAAGCIEIGDRAYFTTEGDAVIQFLVSLAWFLLIYGVLQGLKGVTPGKALFGVQVVDRQGQPPGVGRSLLRSILWVVDGAPWCFPLVGLVTAMATKGHRRVGDMVANTLVVGKAYAGRPVVVPGLTAPQGPVGWAPGGYGAPAPGGWPQPGYPSGQQAPGQPWGAPPPAAPGWAPPPATPTDAPSPAASPYAPPGGPTPAPSPYGPPGGPTPAPGASGETPAPSPYAPPGGSRETPAASPYAPPGGPSPYAPPGGPSAPPSGETGAASPTPSGETPARSPFAMPPASGESPAAAPESAVGDVHDPGGAGTAGGAIDSPGSAGTAEPTGAQPAPAADATEVQPGASDATEVQRGAGDRTEVQPAADPTEVQSGGQGGSGYNPQWDAARNTYIVWEPNQGRWLGWDDTTKEWKPL